MTILTSGSSAEDIPEVVSVEGEGQPIETEILEPSLQERQGGIWQQETSVRVNVTAMQRGLFEGKVNVLCRAPKSKAEQRVEARITWSVPSLFRVTPVRVFIPRLSQLKETIVEREIVISPTDGSSFAIRSVESSHPAVSLKLLERSDEAGPSRKIRIGISREKLTERALWTEVLVHTDNEAEPVLKVPVAAFY